MRVCEFISYLQLVPKNIMLNEKNKVKDTNNLIPKMSDRLKHVDYLWRPFWSFSNTRIMRRTHGSDLAPPNY